MEFTVAVLFVTVLFSSSAQAVSNARQAKPEELPFAVHLQITDYSAHKFVHCGGSIVSPNIVVTAAHCVHNISESADGGQTIRVKVLAGELRWNLETNNVSTTSTTAQIRLVKQILIHEHYDESTLANDIAVLVLTHPFDINLSIRPILIPEKDQKFNGTAKFCGWGQTELADKSDVLLIGQAEILLEAECKNLAQTLQLDYDEEEISIFQVDEIYQRGDPFICAAGQHHIEICPGDSGGPAFCNHSHQQYLCGVVSWGLSKNCGVVSTSLQGFTDVASYSEWIKEKIDTHNFTCPNPTQQFNCGDGQTCVPLKQQCDGVVNCPTDTDEMGCSPCKPSQFRCTGQTKCIDEVYVCDSVKDCKDGSDELGCSVAGFAVDKFWCGKSGKREELGFEYGINKSLVCDREKDCPYGEDELGCDGCTSQEFHCNNGECIEAIHVCDGTPACQDHSDEQGCKNISVQLGSNETPCSRSLDLATCVLREGCTFNEASRECLALASLVIRRITPTPTPAKTDENDKWTEFDYTIYYLQEIKQAMSAMSESSNFVLICVVVGIGLLLALGLVVLYCAIRRRLPLPSNLGQHLIESGNDGHAQ